MKKLSWILLLIVAALTLLASLESAWVALRQKPDRAVGVGVAMIHAVAQPPEVAQTIHARRLTAAAYGAAFSVLLFAVIWFPYRRGEVWSWWAILVTSLVLCGLVALRLPVLGTMSGVGTALVQFALVVVGLLLGVGRLRVGKSS